MKHPKKSKFEQHQAPLFELGGCFRLKFCSKRGSLKRKTYNPAPRNSEFRILFLRNQFKKKDMCIVLFTQPSTFLRTFFSVFIQIPGGGCEKIESKSFSPNFFTKAHLVTVQSQVFWSRIHGGFDLRLNECQAWQGCGTTLPNGRTVWLTNGGDPNHLQVRGWSSK